ncbi:phosphate ABC transporter substrate-binding protein [Bacterioplanoides pacificum]|uniref:Phosphate ABC transporter substrate-binding protein n=1 Tax=Bacterioplanoides pacificum TaxID=1171596 RepID=A0ABV7VT34_9GAMM
MKLIKALGLAAAMSLSMVAQADIAIIVNLKNQNTYTGIDTDLVSRIYLGKANKFPDGSSAVPYNLAKGDDIRDRFTRSVLNKTPSQLHSYWSRQIFAGKKQPPRDVADAAAMKKAIAEDLNGIGYINSLDVDTSVAVLHTIKD